MVKVINFTFEELSEVLDYDPKTGDFTWKVTTSPRAKKGNRAGVWQQMQNGKDYYSITYQGRKLSGAQVAWLLAYKEWPDRSVFYVDGNTKNLKISNLKMAEFKSEKTIREDGSVKYSMHKDQVRHYGLNRYYGISVNDFAEMYHKQDGKCAICGNPETVTLRGKVKPLSVDHNHATGQVRKLLCTQCNHLLGHAKEDVKILQKAIEYLNNHSSGSPAEDLGTPVTQTGLADAAQTV